MTTTKPARTTPTEDGVDTVPPLAKLLPLGLQHVLAMYAGAIAVPLIVGGALGFSSADLAFLISADLFVAGLATIVQSVGFWRFGVRLPLVQGVTFAAVGPMIAIGTEHGITAVYGATIACGVFMVVIAPWFAQLVRLFPPIVTGTVILIIGLSLMSVAAGWVTDGGKDGAAKPLDVAFAAGVLLAIVLVERFAPRGLARVSVLSGLLLGTVAALFVPGMVDGSGIADASWFAFVTPFHFGLPTFDVASIVSMLVVGLVIMTETTGDMIAVGEVTGRPVSKRTLADGLRADGLGTVVGGVFNTFPYTAFAQNVGLVALTGVRSRYVATAAGGILVVLGLVPKVAAVVEAIPHAVLGGAGVALFGMVAASGIRTLSKVRFDNRNVLVVALPLGIALLPTVAPSIYAAFPTWFTLVFDSGISAGAVAAILLNLLLGSRSVAARYGEDPAVGSYDGVRSTAPIALPRSAEEARAADPA
ncbi:nucleobase:cation symporter-2, NCS2 family [Curtobacterium sp. UNCCL20]|uniref:nucleobase:cation symporter-2 family protein n=1 Tax=Curtobacterium sp. UNCCL20 TaxID=1502773 RepID=UPI00087FF937|nr:nucleobase:cation symporter-2 family protein [Curtobacterium sp. UNCCL20]SDQ12124.1 nucleobase:cation symporter-2, NCS2 family [Curtobacterium sp. UNCCL20]